MSCFIKRVNFKLTTFTLALCSKNGHNVTKNEVTEKCCTRMNRFSFVLSIKIAFGLLVLFFFKKACLPQKFNLFLFKYSARYVIHNISKEIARGAQRQRE